MALKAPFPYFGNKHLAAPLIWDILGDTKLYIEPFAGALGVYLGRPKSKNDCFIEVLCDYSALITNIWRACKYMPYRTALYCSDGSKMADYHAKYIWIQNIDNNELYKKLESDYRFCDPEIAGVTIWLLSSAIGDTVSHLLINYGHGVNAIREIPHASSYGHGVNAIRKIPHASSYGHGVNAIREIPRASNYGHGVKEGDFTPDFARYGEPFYDKGVFIPSHFWKVADYLYRLSDRLALTDIMIDSFENILDNPTRFLSKTQISRAPTCGIYLDPPYEMGCRLYGESNYAVIHDKLIEWCINHEKYFTQTGYIRVILSSYDGEYDKLLDYGWECIAGKQISGYSNEPGKEVLYLSPQAALNYKKIQCPLFN